MTDNGFSFGSFGGQTPAGRQVEQPKSEEAPAPKRARLALGAAGAAAAVALAAVAVVTMGGGEDPAQAVAPASPPKASATAAVTAAPTMIPAAYDGLTGTDPFRPLIVRAAAGSGSQLPGPTSPAPLPAPTVTIPVPGPTVTVSANPVPGPTTTVTAAPAMGWTVRLVAVAADGTTADVAINGQLEKGVKVNGTFGGGMFALLGTDAPDKIALIQFGDSSFYLAVGSALTVM